MIAHENASCRYYLSSLKVCKKPLETLCIERKLTYEIRALYAQINYYIRCFTFLQKITAENENNIYDTKSLILMNDKIQNTIIHKNTSILSFYADDFFNA